MRDRSLHATHEAHWTRDAGALGVSLAVVLTALSVSDHLDSFPSAVLGGVLAVVFADIIGRTTGSTLPLGRVALLSYAVAASVGAVVMADNQRNFGIPFSSGFDDGFYWFNTERLAQGIDDGTHVTLFERFASLYYRLLAVGGDVVPADLLPLNWALSAVTVATVFAASEALLGVAPPLGLSLLATYGNAQFCLCVPYFYRDMLVAAGFAAAVLYALRGNLWFALAACGVVLGTRTAHGFLALFVVASVLIARTDFFRRNPRAVAGSLAVLVTAGALVVSRGSAAMLSGRAGEDDSRDVASYAVTRQQEIVAHLEADDSSLGARVIALGPVGIPLRMVSGYFAPVTLQDPEVERSFNTLLIPWRIGDVLRARFFVVYMMIYWVTVLSWPVLVAPLILGMRRLERAPGTRRVLFRSLVLCFLLVMTISMQERHRVPLLAFNPLFLAAWRAEPPTESERHLAYWIGVFTLAAITTLNIYVILRRG